MKFTHLARPQTTVCAQGRIISMKESLSKNPLIHKPFFAGNNNKRLNGIKQ